MSQQVERLQALLERVQRNRTAAPNGVPVRAAAVAAKPAAAPKPAAVPPPPEAITSQVAAPAPTTSPGRRAAPTPLEMALEGRASRVASMDAPTQPITVAPAAPTPAPAPAPAPRAQAPAAAPAQRPAPAAAPAAKAAPAPVEGRMLVEAAEVQATKPIAQVVSKQPPIAASSFGELLRRSLSLRPR